jgi:outer membrane protein assembly factor BamB
MKPSSVRWRWLAWPAGILILLVAGALAWIWSTEFPQRQDQVVRTLLLTVLGGALVSVWSLVWLLAFSGLRWRVRWIALAVVGLVVLAAGFSIEVRGFSGDVIPILGWRWSSTVDRPEPAGSVPPGAGSLASEFDYPQFQGPFRDGSVPGVRLSRDASRRPRELWRQPVGAAWSGFAVAGDYAVTQEQRGEQELVNCYDLKSGKLAWSHTDRARWEDPIGGPGPRATPAIEDGRVYAFGGTGILNAIDLASGELLWSRNVLEENGAAVPTYGVSASPLVLQGRVVVAAGGSHGRSLVAYEAATGEPLWGGGTGAAAYGSPRHAVLAGTSQILILNDEAVVAHAPDDGRVLWEFEWPGQTERTFQPVVLPGDRVFVSSGYGVGGKLLRVRADPDGGLSVDLLWESRGLKAKFTNVVYADGFLYGLDDGILVCLDPETGERRWKRGRYGHGQILLVEDLLLVLGENGNVALVEVSPEAYREVSRFPALEGKTWNHPALAGPYLIVRNDREAACYELPLREDA